jgi:hypothetical protein
MMRSRTISLLLSFAMLALSACVGTVEDKNPETTKAQGLNLPPIFFTGIDRVVPIAHNKAEVMFYPATGSADNLTYLISYDGLDVPLSVGAVSLRPDFRGLLSYTVSGLQINTEYVFQVQVKDKTTGQRSTSPETRKGKTFANITASFDGIANIKNLPGYDGTTSLKIEWSEAVRSNPLLPPLEGDAIQYEITLVDADELTPGDMDDVAFGLPKRVVVPVPIDRVDYTVTGLQSDTKYHAQVRAVHHGFSQFGALPGYKKEENHRYLTLSTLSDELASIQVNLNDRSLALGAGESGLTSMDVTWGEVQGAFDHFRIYYTYEGDFVGEGFVSNDCGSGTVYQTFFYCKKVEYLYNTTKITDLVPGEDYKVKVYICQDDTCSPGKRLSYDVVNKKLEPPVATFAGILGIKNSSTINALDSVIIEIEPPDFGSGVIDGLAVKVLQNPDLGVLNDTYINLPDANGDGSYDGSDVTDMPLDAVADNETGLSVLPFDFKSDEFITVSGVILGSGKTYSFMVVPYTYTPDGQSIRLHEGTLLPMSISPNITMPSAADFIGIASISCDLATQTVVIAWDVPAEGVWSGFRAYRTTGAAFNYTDAKNGAYNSSMVSASATETSFPFLSSGQYSFGILASLVVSGDVYYSGDNSGIRTINIPGDCE